MVGKSVEFITKKRKIEHSGSITPPATPWVSPPTTPLKLALGVIDDAHAREQSFVLPVSPLVLHPSTRALNELVEKLVVNQSFPNLGLQQKDVRPFFSTIRGNSYPTRSQGARPDLLLYTLTDDDRYNGSATSLRKALKSKPLLVHGVSGAGKTRAALDILANNQNDDEYGVYLDLGNLGDGELPEKNFYQFDVDRVGVHFWGLTDLVQARHIIRCLILSRVVLLHVLKRNGWDTCHLLYAQLGIGAKSRYPLLYTWKLYQKLLAMDKNKIITVFGKVSHKLLVVIDEAHVALSPDWGQYKAATSNAKSRPLLSPLYGVLKGTRSIIAGTNMSFGNVLSPVVSQMGCEVLLPFNGFTSLNEERMIDIASKYFGVRGEILDVSILGMLKGRCRFFMAAINTWLTKPEIASFEDAIAKTVSSLQDLTNPNSPHTAINRFIKKHRKNREFLSRVTDDLLTSFIQGQRSALAYEPDENWISDDQKAINEIVDMSIAMTSNNAYELTLNEPLVAFGLIQILGNEGIWSPTDTVLKQMCQNQNQNAT